MIDNIVVPVATGYGLSEEYRYLKSSIREFLTGLFSSESFYQIKCKLSIREFNALNYIL